MAHCIFGASITDLEKVTDHNKSRTLVKFNCFDLLFMLSAISDPEGKSFAFLTNYMYNSLIMHSTFPSKHCILNH